MPRWCCFAVALAACNVPFEALTPASLTGDAGLEPVSTQCLLDGAAFCDPLSEPQPGGRAGDLDEAVWSVARLSFLVNPPQGLLNLWAPAAATLCGQQNPGALPDSDLRICQGALEESIDDGHATTVYASKVYRSMRVRQPWNFSQGALAVFDVDAITWRDGVWFEVWVTDAPVPAGSVEDTEAGSVPANAVGLMFNACPGGTSVEKIFEVRNQTVTPNVLPAPPCFTSASGVFNHFELRLSPSHVELWGIDSGGGALRLLGASDLSLPFGTGFLSLVHVEAASSARSDASSHAFRWRRVGFTGPRAPRPFAHSVPDLLRATAEGMNLGYLLKVDVNPEASQSFALPATSTAARLDFDLLGFEVAAGLRWRLDGAAWRDAAVQYESKKLEHVTLDLGVLPAPSTLELALMDPASGGFGSVVSNLDLTAPTGGTVAPGAANTALRVGCSVGNVTPAWALACCVFFARRRRR